MPFACDPGGNGILHVLQFATGQPPLLDTDLATPVAAMPIGGIGTEVALVSVDGQVEINTGSSKGTVARNRIRPDRAGAAKQINRP